MSLRFVLGVLGVLLMTTACTSSQNQRPSTPPALAPQSAEVSTLVKMCSPHPVGYRCELEVQEVHRYGANTRPLASTSRLTVRIPETLLSETPTEGEMPFALDTALRLTVRYTMQAGTANPDWVAVQIH